MKTTIRPSFIIAALSLSLFTSAATAQTSTNITGTIPTIAAGLTEVYEALATSGLATATNYAMEPYLTYAPNAPAANRVGGGALMVYNVNAFTGAGLGVDYLGHFSLVSANVTLRMSTHPLSFLGGSWTNVALTPFALAGVGTPLSGTSSGFAAITDAGAYLSFGNVWGGHFNTGTCYGRWDNAGAYSGPRYHFFIGWSKGF